MVRKSEEFRLGTSSGPWVERRVDCLLDFGVATCGVYCKFSLRQWGVNEMRVELRTGEYGTDLGLSD